MAKKRINKILIANRGEIALRVVRACKELDIETVAVYSKVDENSLHRRFADSSVCVGEAPPSDSYLNIPRIIAAAEISNADAIHPGYGFLAENADFADACRENNLIFIGPSAELIRKMGDKVEARKTMEACNVPIIPGSQLLRTLAEALAEGKRLGYPVMLKASHGGGGRGMRLCRKAKELEAAYAVTRHEAQVSFGNDEVYLEKFIESGRHIEVQILADAEQCLYLGERDCSIQRRKQKLIEETPSPFLNDVTRKKLNTVAAEAARQVGYMGAGTIEFLMDHKRNFYFMEMNTRIQVEHTISELYTGIDIVKEQINVAAGLSLSHRQETLIFRGHVIECRINSEDVYKDFAPVAGKIGRCHFPQGLGVRVDTHIYSGYEVPPNYDSMIAKLIVWGLDREEAMNRMKRSLAEFVVENIPTTIPFHEQIMRNKHFREGKFNIDFLDNFKMQAPKRVHDVSPFLERNHDAR